LFYPAHLFGVLARGEDPLEFLDESYPTKTRGMGLLYSENVKRNAKWHIYNICYHASACEATHSTILV